MGYSKSKKIRKAITKKIYHKGVTLLKIQGSDLLKYVLNYRNNPYSYNIIEWFNKLVPQIVEQILFN